MPIAEPKIKEMEVQVAPYQPDRHLKIIYRDIALVEPSMAEGAWYARDLEAYVDGLVERDGWRIMETHIVGRRDNAPAHGGDKLEPVLQMVVILVK